jgi:hypothetical protein
MSAVVHSRKRPQAGTDKLSAPSKRCKVGLRQPEKPLRTALDSQGPRGITFLVVLDDDEGTPRPILALVQSDDPHLSYPDYTLQIEETVKLPCSEYHELLPCGAATFVMSKSTFELYGGKDCVVDGEPAEIPSSRFHVITAPCNDAGLITVAKDLWADVCK